MSNCLNCFSRRLTEGVKGKLQVPTSKCQSGDPWRGLMQDETPQTRASLLAATDEGVRRHARGGRAPQFLKRITNFQ